MLSPILNTSARTHGLDVYIVLLAIFFKTLSGTLSGVTRSARLLPQRSQGSILENHMLLIANSVTVASQTNPVIPVHMVSTSQNGQ